MTDFIFLSFAAPHQSVVFCTIRPSCQTSRFPWGIVLREMRSSGRHPACRRRGTLPGELAWNRDGPRY